MSNFTYDVNHDILLELLSILNSKLSYFTGGFKVIGIHVYNWDIECFAQLSSVFGGSLVLRHSGVADLIVHHYVYAAVNLN